MAKLHSEVSSRAFQMDRRQLMKLTAAAVLAGKFINMDEAAAAEACTAIGKLSDLSEGLKDVPKKNSKMDESFGEDFLYWIDGPMNKALDGYTGDLVTRARLSCTMHLPHGPSSFIETVILTDAEDKIIAQQYFDPSSKLIGGWAPYVVFENLDLDKSKSLKVLFIQNNNDKAAVVFEHEIKDPQPSRFDYAHLHTRAKNKHILGFLHEELNAQSGASSVNYRFQYFPAGVTGKTKADTETAGSGFITTPFGTWFNGPHTARAKISNINKESGDFEIVVDLMHGDTRKSADKEGDYHYMRYFMVLDPVGRVLGAVRRMYEGDDMYNGNAGKVIVRKGFWTPIKKTMFGSLDAGDKSRCYGQSTTDEVVANANINASDSNLKSIYAPLHTVRTSDGKIDKSNGFFFPADPMNIQNIQLNSVNILNCPHIQIVTDDKYHALARCSLRLR